MPVQKKLRRRSNALAPDRPFAERNGVLMTFEEAADYLGVKKATVENLVKDGVLPVIPVSKRNRQIHIDDLRVYIETQRTTGRRER